MRLALPFLALTAACAPGEGTDLPVRYLEQEAICDRMIDCIAEVQPSGTAAAIEGYGDDSVCWQDDEDRADTCATACREAVLGLLELDYEAGGCVPDDYAHVALAEGDYGIDGTALDDCAALQDPYWSAAESVELVHDEIGTFTLTAEFWALVCEADTPTQATCREAEGFESQFEYTYQVTATLPSRLRLDVGGYIDERDCTFTWPYTLTLD